MDNMYIKQAVKSIDDIVFSWSHKAQTVAYTMVEKYGMPRETTPSMLIWYHNGQWKQTIVHREGMTHNFPTPHVDLLEQVIDYWVPIEKIDEVVAFDGSINIDRTKGQMSVCCYREETNYLALNLAHDIITGQKTVKEARQKYADTVFGLRHNWNDPYVKGLIFHVPDDTETHTSDPDKAVFEKNIISKIGDRLGF